MTKTQLESENKELKNLIRSYQDSVDEATQHAVENLSPCNDGLKLIQDLRSNCDLEPLMEPKTFKITLEVPVGDTLEIDSFTTKVIVDGTELFLESIEESW